MRKQENFGVWNIDVRTTQMTFGVQEKSKKKKKKREIQVQTAHGPKTHMHQRLAQHTQSLSIEKTLHCENLKSCDIT